MTTNVKLKAKDFKSDQEVRWCPGCGDYSILNSVQGAFAKLGKQLHETVIIFNRIIIHPLQIDR